MKKKIAKLIADQSQYVGDGDEELSYRDSYSGRGMYGTDTAAVSGDEYLYHLCVIACVNDMIENFEGKNMQLLSKKVDEFLNAALNATTDSMGMGVVWY